MLLSVLLLLGRHQPAHGLARAVRLLTEDAIETILDGVFTPSRQELGNLTPLVANGLLLLDQQGVLRRRPFGLAHRRIKVVKPALTALLPGASGEVRRRERPLLRPEYGHQFAEQVVLVGGPGALDLVPSDLGPAVPKVDGRKARQGFIGTTNAGPGLAAQLQHSLPELVIVLLAPGPGEGRALARGEIRVHGAKIVIAGHKEVGDISRGRGGGGPAGGRGCASGNVGLQLRREYTKVAERGGGSGVRKGGREGRCSTQRTLRKKWKMQHRPSLATTHFSKSLTPLGMGSSEASIMHMESSPKMSPPQTNSIPSSRLSKLRES